MKITIYYDDNGQVLTIKLVHQQDVLLMETNPINTPTAEFERIDNIAQAILKEKRKFGATS